MFWAMGAMLLQLQLMPQVLISSASKPAVVMAQKSMLAESSAEVSPLEPGRLIPTPVAAVTSSSPAAAAAAAPFSPVIATRRRPQYSGSVSSAAPKQWLALSMAGHGAAVFDAWSTRRAIGSGGAQELNPLLKPFAGNNSIYAATQVGPALLDLLAHKMMTSQHPLLRHTWWLPQTLGTVASLASGTHNLGVR